MFLSQTEFIEISLLKWKNQNQGENLLKSVTIHPR